MTATLLILILMVLVFHTAPPPGLRANGYVNRNIDPNNARSLCQLGYQLCGVLMCPGTTRRLPVQLEYPAPSRVCMARWCCRSGRGIGVSAGVRPEPHPVSYRAPVYPSLYRG